MLLEINANLKSSKKNNEKLFKSSMFFSQGKNSFRKRAVQERVTPR
jgi:hypothetical protein